MKRNFLKNYNRIIALLLSIIGAGSACSLGGCMYGTPAEYGVVALYGVPSADYKVYGKVYSKNNAIIPNIRVVMQSDTTVTDNSGNYNVQVKTFPKDQDFSLEFDDIDGNVNEAYQSKDTIVSFKNVKFIGGDGDWYTGETSKELNIKLEDDH